PPVERHRHQVVGVEALLRWPVGAERFIPPLAFIPILEAAGKIGVLTRWVVHRALAQLARWHECGFAFGMSINVARADVLDVGFAAFVRTQAALYGIAPELLTFELAATSIIADAEGVLEGVCALRDVGVQIALDDFSTAYGAFPIVGELPLRTLKIDRTFVMGMSRLPNDEAVVRSTIVAAHDLGLTATAEGVYSKRVLDLLSQAGCDEVQGFQVSPPQSAEDISDWLGKTSWLTVRQSPRAMTTAR
ncbi:MAG: EAL domain-containing protein (putative c-di-GMP-specific phosphodiesterase class I), partial [Gammaproteobacteria bacterium]